ncbi:lipoprotein [uncultured Cardiobacterium sp.]|uniref:LPS translocon maturation chaperone LptM n=1 Tax=uncultured Cardiobacterium sp. TaxID=417619 RepID=UPI00341E21E0
MMGAKSLPSAPSPCSQMMLCVGVFAAGSVIRSGACVIIFFLFLDVFVMCRVCFVVIVAVLFAGCGQKGPLYLPERQGQEASDAR